MADGLLDLVELLLSNHKATCVSIGNLPKNSTKTDVNQTLLKAGHHPRRVYMCIKADDATAFANFETTFGMLLLCTHFYLDGKMM